MGIAEHKTSFAGFPVVMWTEGPLIDPANTAYHIAYDRNGTQVDWDTALSSFLSQPNISDVRALLIGAAWAAQNDVAMTQAFVEALVTYHERLPNLRAVFIGDATYEECEISWIRHTDLSSLFLAFPQLEHFGVRGTEDLRFGVLNHAALKSFVLESGGTPMRLLDELKAAHLPALIHFEMWTGDGNYGWDGTLDDLRPVLTGQTFPHLTHLGMCNSDITDEIVLTLLQSPFYDQLDHLDLTRGSLSDTGARALLHHPHTRHLKSLDVRHHYCSTVFEAELTALKLFGVTVHIDKAVDRRKGHERDDRYAPVGE